jgi:tape measure domain-containing protein
MATIATLAINLIGNVSGLKSALGEAQQSIKATADTLKNVGGAMTAGVSMPIIGVAAAALKGAAEMEQLEVGFTTMLRSADKAKALMEDLTEFSAATPFELPGVLKAGKMLLAYQVEAEDVQDTLRKLGDVAAGVGVPIEDMAFLFGTAKVQGRLFSADINQFTSRGVPIISALAKTMGVAEGSIKKMVEEGKVGFPELQNALDYLTTSGGQFEGLMAAQSQTLAGLFSTLKDTVGISLSTIGRSIVEAFDLRAKLGSALEVLGKVKEFIVDLATTNPQMLKLGVIIAAVAASIGPLLVALGMIVGAVGNLVPVIGMLASAFAFLLSPLGLVVAGLAALVYFDVGGIRTKFVELGQAIWDFGQRAIEVAPELGSNLKGAMEWIWNGQADNIDWWYDIATALGFTGDTALTVSDLLYNAGVRIGDALAFVRTTGDAFQNLFEVLADAGPLSIEASEALSLFPAALQPIVGWSIAAWGGLSEFVAVVEDAGLSSIEANEALGLLPAGLQGIVSAFQTAVELLQTAWSAILELFEPSIARLQTAFGGMVTGLADLGPSFTALQDSVVNLAAALIPIIQTLGYAIVGALGLASVLAVNTLSAVFEALPGVIEVVISQVTATINLIATTVQGMVAIVSGLLTGDFAGAWEGVKTVVGGLNEYMLTTLGNMGTTVLLAFGLVKDVLLNTFSDLASAVGLDGVATAISGIDAAITAVVNNLKNFPTTIATKAPEWIDTLIAWMWPDFIEVPTWVTTLLDWMWPDFIDLPNWVATLVVWAWPSFTTQPSWVSTLFSWEWPTFISQPTWLAGLFSWDWPAFPSAPDWLTNLNPFGGNATGTSYWSGGPSWVGERGPELINLPRGSQVFTNQESRRMVAAGAGGPAVVIQQANIRDERDVYLLAYQVDDLRRRRSRR